MIRRYLVEFGLVVSAIRAGLLNLAGPLLNDCFSRFSIIQPRFTQDHCLNLLSPSIDGDVQLTPSAAFTVAMLTTPRLLPSITAR